MSENKVWFITGSSTEFGRALAEEVLAKGDRVVATARKPEGLRDLLEKYPDAAPGPFSTNGFESAVFAENPVPGAYPSTAQFVETFQQFKAIAGDPVKAVRVIIEAGESANPPFRLPLGLPAYEAIEAKLESVKKEIAVWRDRATQTNFDAATTA